MDRWQQEYRDAVIETGFWLVVVMVLLAVVIVALLTLVLPAPPPEPVSAHARLQRSTPLTP